MAPSIPTSYYELSNYDTVLAAQLAEEIAGAHIGLYRDERFEDLAGLTRHERAWYEAIGAYALRFCRKAWRVYAYDKAVDRGVQVVEDLMQHCFRDRTAEGAYVRMPPAQIRALVGILATEIINAHRHALDGTLEPTPGETVRLHEAERAKGGR